MALNTTNITQTIEKNILSETQFGDFYLAISGAINKWSKCKPVRGTFPQSDTGKYGFNLPTNWDYLHPRGLAYSEGGRQGDFRGYEHSKVNAFPTIQCRDTDNTFAATLYPTSSGSFLQQFFLRAFRSASSVLIIPSDLGLDSYYVGLKLSFGGATWYKTFGQVSDLTATKVFNILISAELVGTWGDLHYSNLPTVSGLPVSGEGDWQLILCSTSASAWTNGAPSNIIYFPTDSDGTNTFLTSGSFNVANWIYFNNAYGFSQWYHDETLVYGTAEGYIYTSFGHWHLHYCPSWITFKVYTDNTKGTILNNPSTWDTGNYIVFYPNSYNAGAVRQDDIILSDPTDVDHLINITCIQTGSGSGGGEGSNTISVSVAVAGGENWTLNATYTTGVGYHGNNYIDITFRPVSLGTSSTPVYINVSDNQTVTNLLTHARDGFTDSVRITLPANIGTGTEGYTVSLTRNAI